MRRNLEHKQTTTTSGYKYKLIRVKGAREVRREYVGEEMKECDRQVVVTKQFTFIGTNSLKSFSPYITIHHLILQEIICIWDPINNKLIIIKLRFKTEDV